MRQLPREVDPLVYKMSHEDPGNISYSEVGGLSEQIRELREVRSSSFVEVVLQLCLFTCVRSCYYSICSKMALHH